MTSATAGPFTLTGSTLAPASVTAGARAGGGSSSWLANMLQGEVFGAGSPSDAFYGTPADDVIYGTVVPPDDPGGSTAPDSPDDSIPIPPGDLNGPTLPDTPDDETP